MTADLITPAPAPQGSVRAAAPRAPRHWHTGVLKRVARWTASLLLAATAACGDEGSAAAERPQAEADAKADVDGPTKTPVEAGEGAERGEQGERGEGGEGAEGGGAAASGRVTLTEAAFATARIAVEPVRAEAAAAVTGGLSVPGQVEFDPARVALVSPRAAGRIERLLAVPGDRVGAGQVVALLYSPAYLTAQADLQQATRRRALLAGTADAEGATALLGAARRRLLMLGATEAEARALEGGAEPRSLLAVRAPFAGSITEAHALAGAAVEPGAPLFTIADVSAVNVAANVPERALAAVRIGQPAAVQIAARPGVQFAGRVTRVSDVVDSASRTVEALVRVANSGRLLKPGMFATVTLRGASAGGAAGQVLTIPASAVVTNGATRYVLVEVGPRTYVRRTVELAPGGVAGGGPAAGRVAVVSGLAPGDRVVTRGAFTLKSELAKASLVDED